MLLVLQLKKEVLNCHIPPNTWKALHLAFPRDCTSRPVGFRTTQQYFWQTFLSSYRQLATFWSWITTSQRNIKLKITKEIYTYIFIYRQVLASKLSQFYNMTASSHYLKNAFQWKISHMYMYFHMRFWLFL